MNRIDFKTTVLGETVTILHVPNLRVGDDDCEGACYASERMIKIDSNISDPARYKRVVDHELAHMLMRISGVAETLNEQQEEALAVLMEVHPFEQWKGDR